MSRIVRGVRGLAPNQVCRSGAMRWTLVVRVGRGSVSVVSMERRLGPVDASIFADEEAGGEEGAAGSEGVSRSGGAAELETEDEEEAWGRGAAAVSGCWTTKRLGWRTPRGWAEKSAMAMPEPVPEGAAGSSGWGMRGWRRPQK